MEWLDAAMCRDKHQEIWFPPVDPPKPPHGDYNDVAKLVCDRCPVREECAEYGEDQEWGTWGGITQSERRRGLPFKAPRKTITEAQIMTMIPRHISDTSLDIKALRTQLFAVSERKRPGQP
jgi:WhiB family redox-sensing transcriptional regulator